MTIQTQNKRKLSGFFEISRRCNLSCTHCFVPIENRSWEVKEDALVLHACHELLQKADTEGYTFGKLALVGAEPTLLEPATLREVSQLISTHTGIRTNVQSNGTLLTPLYLDALGASQSFLSFGISIDGPAVIHNQRRGPTYEKIWANVRSLRERKYPVAILSGVGSDTIARLPEFAEWLRMLEAERIHFGLRLVFGESAPAEEEKIKFADWLIETGHYKYFKPLAKVMCIHSGNNCFGLAFDAEGSVWACNKAYGTGEQGKFASWKHEDFSTILLKRKNLFLNEATARECETCAYLPRCHSGCPLSRKVGRADDCIIRIRVFRALENKTSIGL